MNINLDLELNQIDIKPESIGNLDKISRYLKLTIELFMQYLKQFSQNWICISGDCFHPTHELYI
jgi:hypothetical protein